MKARVVKDLRYTPIVNLNFKLHSPDDQSSICTNQKETVKAKSSIQYFIFTF